MRVLVCSDRVGEAAPAEAGAAVARAFVQAGGGRSQLAVVPLPSAPTDAVDALAGFGRPGTLIAADGVQALAAALLDAPAGTLYLDLTGWDTDPAHAPRLLAALGASKLGADVPALQGLAALDLAEVRARLAGRSLVAFVSDADAEAPLLGLTGVAARAAFERGESAAAAVPADEGLQRLAAVLGVPDAPGLGAAGGVGLVVTALGGRLTTPTTEVASASGLERTLPQADLVVTVSDTVTTGNFGGATLLTVAPRARAAEVPCLALAREVEIARRELRQHGVEAAHALGGGPAASASEIEERSLATARSWTW